AEKEKRLSYSHACQLSGSRVTTGSSPAWFIPDLAVIGFDDTEYGALVTPALTTVRIDAEVHGRLAARAALGLDPAGLSPEPGRIIARDSA
ncbi:substrate-binding domain-containing protein, partial [Streptomyces mirabilis]